MCKPPTHPLADVLLKYADTLKEFSKLVGNRSSGDTTDNDPLNEKDGPPVPGRISV